MVIIKIREYSKKGKWSLITIFLKILQNSSFQMTNQSPGHIHDVLHDLVISKPDLERKPGRFFSFLWLFPLFGIFFGLPCSFFTTFKFLLKSHLFINIFLDQLLIAISFLQHPYLPYLICIFIDVLWVWRTWTIIGRVVWHSQLGGSFP